MTHKKYDANPMFDVIRDHKALQCSVSDHKVLYVTSNRTYPPIEVRINVMSLVVIPYNFGKL